MSSKTSTHMIIGGGLLFAGCGEETVNPPTIDAGPQTVDAGSPADTGVTAADTGVIADTGPLLDTGPAPADAGSVEAGPEPVDAGPPAVPPNNGERCTDRGDVYCAAGLATFYCTGTHWQRTDNYDCDACEEGGDFDGYSEAMCGVLGGAECSHRNQAFCDEQLRPEAVCGIRWQMLDNDGMCSPCEVDQVGYLTTACAVPGFIGLHRAGQSRHPGQSIRRS